MSVNTCPESQENLVLPPEPQQLFGLAAIAIEVAKKQSMLRNGYHYNNAKFLRVRPIQMLYGEDEQGARIGFEHKLVGHIRRIAPTQPQPWRSWSLRLGWSIWAKHAIEGDLRGVASVYSFEWDESSVTKAIRQAHTLPKQDRLSMEDTIDRFGLTDEAGAQLAADIEMGTVSRADCDLLQEDIANFCHLSELVASEGR